MKKKTKSFIPLQLLRHIEKQYPGCWNQMDAFHEANGSEPNMTWNPAVYVPMAGAIAVTTSWLRNSLHTGPQEYLKRIADAAAVCALASWRRSKEVFVLDADLEHELCQQDDEKIPSQILMQLPYPCFYVQTNDMHVDEETKIDGFFVFLEEDMETHRFELRLIFVQDERNFWPYMILLDSRDLDENLRQMDREFSRIRSNQPSNPLLMAAEGQNTQTHDMVKASLFYKALKSALQIVLYLISEDNDVSEDPKQKAVCRRSAAVKDRFTEVRKWEVGVRIGSSLRKYRSDYAAGSVRNESGTHQSPRPHMRKGHWHHFWVGKRDSDSRSLKLRWVAPTFVGEMQADEMPVVIHDADRGR